MKHSTYLSAEERDELELWAREYGTSLNYGIRLGVRLLLGLPVPTWARELVAAHYSVSSSPANTSPP